MVRTEEKANRFATCRGIILLAGVFSRITFWSISKERESQKRISEFGKYQGYSEETYDGWKRTSDYLKLSDGTRLAYDLFLPTKDGVPVDEALRP